MLTALKGEADVLPEIVFTFHTETSHPVGIDRGDYTDSAIEKAYNESLQGKAFKAHIRLMPYRCGDGHTYIDIRQANKLQIH